MRGVRVFLIVFGVCAVVAAIAAPLVIRKLSDLGHLVREEPARLLHEAEAFAAEHEQSECEPETLRRSAACSGLFCEVAMSGFMVECLSAARESPELCTGVLQRDAQWTTWVSVRCDSVETDRRTCEKVQGVLMLFCRERNEGQGGQRASRHKELHGTPSPSPSS